MTTTLARPTVEEVWMWLREVPDPEIPVISVVDLGIVRAARWEPYGDRERLVVVITPTYSGCPAMDVIARDIEAALHAHGIKAVRVERQIFPPWTTDRIAPDARERLRSCGIAPPGERGNAVVTFKRGARELAYVACPQCGSGDTERISEFGSTSCKAQYRCRVCREPFDYFKPI
jgi:ring-1,2-phenylacetyl-CoA epoxidase subunit PaaD